MFPRRHDRGDDDGEKQEDVAQVISVSESNWTELGGSIERE